MRLNTAPSSGLATYEGAPAKRIDAEAQLRRSLMSCMLWESEFYESGEDIAARIKSLVPLVPPLKVAAMASEARNKMKLRHAPLWVAMAMLQHPEHKKLVAGLLEDIIQRPDELTEVLAMYWKDGRKSIAHQLQKGLARAFRKFNAYSLSKYNRDNAIKLKDVLFLCHAKPKDEEQATLWKALIAGTLESPDTWEVQLSAGKDKKETWVRLIMEEKLGGLAMLRNLRNMQQVDVPIEVIRSGLRNMKTDRILPYRFIAASKFAPRLEPELESSMFKCLEGVSKLSGETLLLVDVSGSMATAISSKSDLQRVDAACGLAMLARELGNTRIFTFSSDVVEIPARRGFALKDAILNSQPHSSTELGAAITAINKHCKFDRMIVITDEQSHDRVPDPNCKLSYMINVASAINGVGYGRWMHIDGWSEAVLDYIKETEE